MPKRTYLRAATLPYVPTPPQVVAQMLAIANPIRTDVLYGLGSGDERIVIEAARRFGTRVVSHAFHMGDWEPDTAVQVRVNQGTGRATVYAWTIPAQVAGRWTLTTPEGRRVALPLRQRFQRFTGPGGVSGRLVGERIDFTLTERVNGRPVTRRYSGRVTGNGMIGSVAGGGACRAVMVPPGAPR